ncbi:hypothetical protein CBM2637_B50021 [Cupriavidus taiwanensis]|nr:hypothetical protein CBM2637_B50021 [Cupriavidus taiwanensis]
MRAARGWPPHGCCDLTWLLVKNVCQGSHAGSRAMVMQQKTPRPVQFEIRVGYMHCGMSQRDSMHGWLIDGSPPSGT